MKKRLDAMQRVLAVQTQLHRIAEWKLMQLQRHGESLSEAQADLARFVEGEQGLSLALSTVVAKRRASLDHQAARTAQATDIQARNTMEAARRQKLAERAAEQLSQGVARVREAEALKDIIDRHADAGDASLP